MEKEFNLVDEPWICVKMADQSISELSLLDLFKNAHKCVSLAGETKAQDFAVFRFLLSVMYTAFSRYDLNGDEIEDSSTVKSSWLTMWKNQKISMIPIEKYLTEWHDRFWLFDEEHPFYQCNTVKGKSNEIPTAKMIGTLFESNNKGRLFSDRRKEGRILSYPEATRWLLHLNCFDDIAAKNPTPKRPWVGKLGLIAIKGDTLAETLLLNYRAGYTSEGDTGDESLESPSWEQDNNVKTFNNPIPVPNNQAALLSLISRRIFLCRNDKGVTGYFLSGGDYFEDEEVFDEQMTLWRRYEEKKEIKYKPKLYDPSKTIWREFESIAASKPKDVKDEKGRNPGVIDYILYLRRRGVLESPFIKVVTAAVIYDYKQATSLPVIDTVSDSLTFHTKLLEEVGVGWRLRVVEEIRKCDDAAYRVGRLYKELQFSCGRKDKDGKTELSGELDAKALFYDMIDRPFRLWLAAIDPEDDSEDSIIKLEKDLLTILRRLGYEFAEQLKMDSKTIFGRTSDSDSPEVSGARALNYYMAAIKRIFSKAGEEIE